MRISILGAGGFLGGKLAALLAREGLPEGRPVTSLTLFDLGEPAPPKGAAFPVSTVAGDLGDAAALEAAIPPGTELVFHLAAVVSAAAEADPVLGMRVNLDGTRAVAARCAAIGTVPRVVFASSVATFSGGQGAVVEDETRQLPANTYGASKAMAELVLTDATRRGALDAVCLRLPTVSVRPGRPNRAASSFISAILREPLLGLETTLPVPPDFAVWICAPRLAVEWLLHAATLPGRSLGLDRGVNPPGLTVTAGEMLEALERRAGGAARALVRPEGDPAVEAIVGGWPTVFGAQRARALGFRPQPGIDEAIEAFIADDLDATRRDRGLPMA